MNKEQKNSEPRLLFLITEDWYFWSHRLSIARAARDAGFSVTIATRVHKHGERIENEGFQLVPLKLRRKNKNIFRELGTIFQIIGIYRQKRPDIVHHVSLKPVLYGSLAAWICGISSVVNAMAGLGFIFSDRERGLKIFFLKKLLLLALRRAFASQGTFGIFQNPEDVKLLFDAGVISLNKAILIRGAGVNTSRYKYLPEPDSDEIKIVLGSRMLWNKGVDKFVAAIGKIRKQGFKCKGILAGIPDRENPYSIPEQILEKWNATRAIVWLGYRNDMWNVLSQSHIAALPTTYGEGVPKFLIEAASCGRAIVATDVPGCREIVHDKDNGLLVPPNNVDALAGAFKALITNQQLRREMGISGRRLAKTEFSEDIVIKKTMDIYYGLLQKVAIDNEIRK